MFPTRVALSTYLPAPPETVWSLLQRSDSLIYVSAPILRFEPIDVALPETWTEGRWKVKLIGPLGLPLGWQMISVSFPEARPGVWRLRDKGYGQQVKSWDHLIEITGSRKGTLYTDMVDLEAGWKTPAIKAFAQYFYGHRQKRWKQLLKEVGVSEET